jgi:hypothetical protein
MFSRREGKIAIPRPRPVDHADVFVGIGDAVDIKEPGRNKSPGAMARRWGTFSQQFHFEAAFLLGFAHGGLFRIFVQLDVAAERKPLVELAVVDEENLRVMHNEDGDGKINFFVDMSHAEIGWNAAREGSNLLRVSFAAAAL